MKKFGLIGHPIAHSLSPSLFNAAYDGKYAYDLIEGEDFESSYQRFIEEYDAINVTAPFKELAFAKADILSEECQSTGATNLLVKTKEGIKAYNSDYLGVRLWIKMVSDGLKSVLPPKVLIVGTGGAGKAAAEAARSLGYEVILMNRTRYSEETKPLSEFREAFRTADIIIYNLPVRLPELDQLGHEDFMEEKPKHILEANYRNPSFDKELIHKLKGLHPMLEYTAGETWLLLQAVTGYEIFTGETPDLEKMTACL